MYATLCAAVLACVSRCADFRFGQAILGMLGVAKVTHLDQRSLAVVQQRVFLHGSRAPLELNVQQVGLVCQRDSGTAYQLDVPVDNANLVTVV